VAITGPKMYEWRYAMNEIKSINENEMRTLVDLPLYSVALRNAWVFKNKYKTDGNIRAKTLSQILMLF